MGDWVSKYPMRVNKCRLGMLMGIFNAFELVDSIFYKVVSRTARTILAVKKSNLLGCKITKWNFYIEYVYSWTGAGLLYTKRSPRLSSHAREVCFPGGKKDEKESFIEAALRESNEELGLDPKNIEIWTSLPPMSSKDVDGTAVTPVVGIVKEFDLSKLVLNPDEVCDVFVKGTVTLEWVLGIQ